MLISNQRIADSTEPSSAEANDPGLTRRDRPSRIEIIGIPIDSFTPSSLIDYLISQSRMGRGGCVLTPNLDGLRQTTCGPEPLHHVMEADVRVADGMPLIWASRVQGTPLPARVAGSDLILTLSDALAASSRTLFLLGGNPGTAERSAEILKLRSTNLQVVGTYCPPKGFEDDPAEVAAVCGALRQARPDFVYIGLPFVKASDLAASLRSLLPSTWFLGLGVSFSFVCGEVQRAPRWMQANGLEWLHRLTQEPRRLFRRYVLDDFPFAFRLFVAAAIRRNRKARPPLARSSLCPLELTAPPIDDRATRTRSGIARPELAPDTVG